MKVNYLLGVVAWLVLAATAPGQTTRPTVGEKMSPWDAAVQNFAHALVRGDKGAVAGLLAAKPTLHRFNVQHEQTLADLMSLADGATIISARAYEKKPGKAAGELAGDVKQYIRTHDLPDDVSRRLIPQEDAALQRANATCVQWFEVNFDLADADWDDACVAIIALWTAAGKEHHLAFVLVRGKRESADVYRITGIVSGDPLGEQK